MKIELCISRERIPYIVDLLGTDRVTVSEYNAEQDMVSFELVNALDVLYMFHAGFRCGSQRMSEALSR